MARRTIYTLAPEVIRDLKREMARLRNMVRNERARAPTRRGVAGGAKIVRFTLTEDLTAGGSAAATILKINRDGDESDGRAITVYDELDDKEGSSGDIGYAVKMQDSGHYEILVMACI